MKREVVRAAVCGLLVTCLTVTSGISSFASEAQSETQGIVELLETKPVLAGIAQELPKAAAVAVETQEWHNKAVSNVEGETEIYTEASQQSSVAGKMYTNTIVNIEEKGDAWSKVSSGDVTGYVENEKLAFGLEAVDRARAVCPALAVTDMEGVQLKNSPEENAEIAGTIQTDTQYTVMENDGKWIALQNADGTKAYVEAEKVNIIRNSQAAKTIEQITAEEEAARKAAEEEAARKAAEEEAARKAAEEAAIREAEQKKEEKIKNAMSVSVDDRTLLAAIIYCESGAEPYEGKVAVGSVILNRVRSGRFPNSIRDVIYQKGQFGPARTGKLDMVISTGKTTQSCYSAADAALAGEKPVGDSLFFGNGTSGQKIGSHYFY